MMQFAGASFKAHLAQFMWKLRYKSCDAGPDLWIKPEYRPEDMIAHTSYITWVTYCASIITQMMY